MTAKKWNRKVLGATLILLLLIAALQIVIDPFLHYHDCLPGLQYPLKDERFVNDGLQRHRDYEIMITGTSMSLNFNASKAEQLWGVKTIKTGYSGASFHELAAAMENAIGYNPNLKMIICSFDPNKISEDAEADGYEGIPYYLYDSNPFNDVSYLFNKDVITKSIAVLNYTRSGQKTPDMDLYDRFDIYSPTGKEAVMQNYTRMEEADYGMPFTEEDKRVIRENVVNNFAETARRNPQVKFVFYVPPYSYCYWDGLVRTNQADYTIEAIRYSVSLLTEEDNIEVYSFLGWDDVTTDLNNYSDTLHYNGEVCDKITEAVFRGECRLTSENLDTYFEEISKLYQSMDYSDLE